MYVQRINLQKCTKMIMHLQRFIAQLVRLSRTYFTVCSTVADVTRAGVTIDVTSAITVAMTRIWIAIIYKPNK